MDEFELIEHVMDQYNGTPEEFGSLLQEATMRIDHWHTSEFTKECQHRKSFARGVILSLDRGSELLMSEDKFVRGV